MRSCFPPLIAFRRNVPRAAAALTLSLAGGLALAQASGEAQGKLDQLLAAGARIAGDRVCAQAENTFRPIRSGDDELVIGTLWISACRARAEGRVLTLSLEGKAWRWVFRQKEAAGADFEVSGNVRFGFRLGVSGEIDVAYAPEPAIATFWFRTRGEPQVQVTVPGDVEVEKEGLWSDVVAAAAMLAGQSPGSKADQSVQDKARQRIADRLDPGITATYDLCDGTVRSGFEIAPPGEMLPAPETPGRKEAHLHPRALLLSGPYRAAGGEGEHDERLRVELATKAGGAVDARLVCREDALELARAYYRDEALPEVESLAEAIVEGPGNLSLGPRSLDCPVVLVTRRAGDESGEPNATARPEDFRYAWAVSGNERRLPNIDCAE